MGAGPPLVVLHGASSSGREDFAAQIPSMSKAFHLYLPDARGHGRTRWDVADGFSQEQLVDDLGAFVDELGLRTFHLLGFSMGAMTALRFATRHADRLRTLILVGITPEREPRATIARRLMDPVRIERDDPRWAAELSARHDPVQGVGRLATAPADDRRRDRHPAAADAEGPPRDRRADDGRLRRSRPVRAGRPRLGAGPCASRGRGCSSSRTARTRSCRASPRCSIRPWPGSTGRPRPRPGPGPRRCVR